MGERWVPLLCLSAFGVVAVAFAVTFSYPRPDELEHVSYAAFLQETGRWLPQFEAQHVLAIDDMGRWQERLNYLGHPSPYYLFEESFLDRNSAPGRAILGPRLASAALVLLGVAASLWAGWRQFGRDRLALWVFCAGVALCPKLLAVAGQVTNDALGILGGGLAYWGVSVGRRHWGGAAAGLGLMLALWSKPNAGLAVGAWLGVFILQFGAGGLRMLPGLAIGAVGGAVPYWFILRSYGALVPVTVEQFGGVRSMEGFGSYLPAFLVSIGSNWGLGASYAWPPTATGAAESVLFWGMMGCVGVGGAMAVRGARDVRRSIAVAGPLAFLLVLPVHFWFSATTLKFSLPAASVRYYLPIWPALMHALAFGVAEARSRWQSVGMVVVGGAAVVAGWLSP